MYGLLAMISEYLRQRYWSDNQRTNAVRNHIERICSRHLALGLGDPNFAVELCCGDEARYKQRLSEALLGNELLEAGLPIQPSRDGPDFFFQHEGRKVWIEVICPQPTGIPSEWLEAHVGKAIAFPHEAVLLRWTAAIKEKAEKLIGSASTGAKGYLGKGVVGPNDIYVIAVNAWALRGPHFPSITGISQFPFAVEAAFAVGPITLTIDRTTTKMVASGHQHRPTISKPNGANVPAHTFLDSAFRPVSAIWAADVYDCSALGNGKPMAVVHNPEASNPLPRGLLPCHDEYVATPSGAHEYVLKRLEGRLA